MDTGYIALAGGRGRRFGRDKLSQTIGSKSLLQRVVSRLSVFGGDITIVRARGQSLPSLEVYPALRIVEDIYPERGPLGGIYTGLKMSEHAYNIVVAGDMPFLNVELLRYMLGIAPYHDIVVPRVGSMKEPLHAVYSRRCLEPIDRMFNSGDFQVSHLLELPRVRFVESAEIERFDPAHLSFFNINTQADLDRARSLAEAKKDDIC